MAQVEPTAEDVGKPTPKEREWRPLTIATAILGLFGSLVGVVYLFGGLVLSSRLGLRGLRIDLVVASLPREFLIAVGLGVLYQLVTFLLALGGAWIFWWRGSRAIWIGSIVATLVLAYPLARWIGLEPALVLVVLAGTATVVIVRWLVLRTWDRFLSDPTAETPAWSDVAFLLITALWVFVPWRTALEWASLGALDVHVCTKSETKSETLTGKKRLNYIDGLFIGENDEGIYIGEDREESPRIAQIPRSEVVRMFLGEGASGATCPEPDQQGAG